MRSASGRPARQLASVFCYPSAVLRRLPPALGGADAIVFTGGIGENSPEVRARVCEGLAWMGVELDPARNAETTARREGLVSREGSRLGVYVIPTDEELLIARDTVRSVRGVPQRF